MITQIKDFEYHWTQEFDKTQRIFKHIPDRALSQEIAPGYRNMARLAWHIAITISEMMSKTGLPISEPYKDASLPSSMSSIAQAYSESALELMDMIKAKWTDETLQITDQLYGQIWKRGYTLTALIFHQIHHRGQITVLVRQAGLEVPGLYGPARHEWARWGQPEPDV